MGAQPLKQAANNTSAGIDFEVAAGRESADAFPRTVKGVRVAVGIVVAIRWRPVGDMADCLAGALRWEHGASIPILSTLVTFTRAAPYRVASSYETYRKYRAAYVQLPTQRATQGR